MGTYKNKTYPLRIDNSLMDKIRIIAEKEDRKINQQIERMLRIEVQNYEKENGAINLETLEAPRTNSD